MDNQHTIPYNSSDVSLQQWVHGFTNYHMDREERKITVISGTGWKFQYEGESEINMTKDLVIIIPAMKSHKIIKGTSDLVVNIDIEELEG
jgi:hypothetical protein